MNTEDFLAMAHTTPMLKDCPGSSPDPFDSYWSVAGSTDLYSSRTNTMVKATDPGCAWWLGFHVSPIPIASEEELALIIKPLGVHPSWLFAAPSFIQPKAGSYNRDQLFAYAAHLRDEKVASAGTVEARLRAMELRSQGDGELFDKLFPAIDEAYRNEAEARAHIASGKATKLEQVSASFG